MSLNCKNCGANIAAERGPCPYCGSLNAKDASTDNTEDPSKTAVNALKSFVDPTSDYKSSENSIKPNFSDGPAGSSGVDKVWIGIGIAILVLLFFSFL